MTVNVEREGKASARSELYKAIAPFANSDRRKAIRQIFETVLPYAFLWALMIFLMGRGVSYWLTFGLMRCW